MINALLAHFFSESPKMGILSAGSDAVSWLLHACYFVSTHSDILETGVEHIERKEHTVPCLSMSSSWTAV